MRRLTPPASRAVRYEPRAFSTGPESNIHKDLNVATPLVFAPKHRPNLTPLHLLETASLLAPKWRHLSPCLGAALTTSPFVGNLLRVGSSLPSCQDRSGLKQPCALASHLFFQMMRESPLHVTKTKSMPAAYLSPKLIGSILGNSLRLSSEISEEDIRRILREDYGIKSNYINQTQWTGVSVARWLDLFHLSRRTPNHPTLITSLWMLVLWELAESKYCILEYFIELDKRISIGTDGESIFCRDQELVQAILHDPCAREEWSKRRFSEEDVSSPEALEDALDKLLYHDNDMEQARAFELVCATITLQQVSSRKPSIPNGYFGYDGGDAKADCVEVTIREICDLLLWDDSTESFDLTRLASTSAGPASRRLLQLYNGPQEASGKQWFGMLSDIPGCDYLATSPSGKAYELAPTICNISKVLCRLLQGDPNQSDGRQDWTSLQDLSNVWTPNELHIHQNTLTHTLSTGTVARHEIATLQVLQNPNAIELRMRCDWDKQSGFVAVTHLRQKQRLLKQSQINKLRCVIMNRDGIGSLDDASLRALSLALPSDAGRFRLSSCKQKDTGDQWDLDASDFCEDSTRLLFDLLSTRYGCDRRGLIDHNEDDQIGIIFQKKTWSESRVLLKEIISEICILSKTAPSLARALLPWILRESPTVCESSVDEYRRPVHDPDVEDMIFTLPQTILSDSSIQEAIHVNWACRGRAVVKWIQWQFGVASILDVVGDLSLDDLVTFAWFIFKNRKDHEQKQNVDMDLMYLGSIFIVVKYEEELSLEIKQIPGVKVILECQLYEGAYFFSAPVNECSQHRIPNLGTVYIAMNDDMVIAKPVDLRTFFFSPNCSPRTMNGADTVIESMKHRVNRLMGTHKGGQLPQIKYTLERLSGFVDLHSIKRLYPAHFPRPFHREFIDYVQSRDLVLFQSPFSKRFRCQKCLNVFMLSLLHSYEAGRLRQANVFGNLAYIDSPSTWKKVLEQWDGLVSITFQEVAPSTQAVVGEFLEAKSEP